MSDNRFPRDGEEPVLENGQSRYVLQSEDFVRPPEHTARKKKKSSGLPVGAVFAIGALCIVATFMVTYVVLTQQYAKEMREQLMGGEGSPISSATAKLNLIEDMLKDEYLYEIDDEAVQNGILKGYMYSIGDTYAEYFTKEEFELLMQDTNAEMQGIGVSVVYNSEYGAIQIISVFPESPAAKAGVKPGDLIVYLVKDGEKKSVAELGYSIALTALQGKAGTFAEFTVYRGKDLGESVEFSIERKAITEYTVEYRVHSIDKSVGVIRISSFDSKTPEQFKAAVEDLKSKGCTKLAVDVRYNPGGELISVCETLDMLVPEGPVIRTVDKNGNEETVYTSDANETDMPIAVITNGSTASAAELFASCLRDYEKAVLVGENTFGKGSMQTIKSFGDGSGFKYTYRYYCPPFSDNFDGVGIAPDVEVILSEEKAASFYTLTDAEDVQLAAAVAELNK